MAEEADASSAAALTKAIDELKKLFSTLSGAAAEAASDDGQTDEETSTAPATSTYDIVRDQIERASTSFVTTMKWMVGAVAGVALVIFGSGPFLINRDPISAGDWPVVLGLIGVALGVTMVIYSASRVTEPEDASLGELETSFAEVEGWKPMFPGKKRAIKQLKGILTGDDGPAHLGPGCTSVGALIDQLGELQADRLEIAKAFAVASARREAAEATVASLTTELAAVEKQEKATLALVPRHNTPPKPGDSGEHIAGLLASLAGRRTELLGALESARRRLDTARSDSQEDQQRLAAVDAELDVYLAHRTIVLGEAWVAEKRGVFRGARRILVAGSLFAFAGAALYLTGIAVDDDSADDDTADGESVTEPGRALWLPATVMVRATAQAATLLPEACVDEPLDARFESLQIPAPGDGFEVIVLEEACEGPLSITGDDTATDGAAAQVELELEQP